MKTSMWQAEKAMKAAKKTKEEWFGKQNRKVEEACSKENENKDKQKKR